jgi:hypothetical protein
MEVLYNMSLLTSLAHASLVSGASSGASGPILSANMPVVEEGDEVHFTLYVPGGVEGTTYPYTITGISQSDLFYGTLTGNFTLNSVESGNLTIILARDYVEEIETITMTVDSLNVSVQVTITDTSTAPVGEQIYNIPGDYYWVCPDGVTSVSVVAVGAGGNQSGNNQYGGAGGGALGYRNNIAVTPGQTYGLKVGGVELSTNGSNGGGSYFLNTNVVLAAGGLYGTTITGAEALAAPYNGDGGGNGGNGAAKGSGYYGGNGGAGGYSGAGGKGGTHQNPGTSGSGGGGGGGAGAGTSYGAAGGGVGLYGQGDSGAGGANGGAGIAGSGGDGRLYGGGGHRFADPQGTGAVRIMWGPDRSFPDNAEYREGDGLTATLAQTINSPTPATDGRFGDSISISGKYALIGARNEGSYKGRAHIFDMTNGQLVHTLGDFTIGGSFPGFGYSSDIEGNYAAVGSYGEPGPAGEYDAGVVRVYDVTSGNLLYTIQNPTQTKANDWFGQSLRISGIYLIVGTWRDGDVGGSESGRAHIFDMSTGNLVSTINNPSSTPTGHKFGWSVAISGNYAIIGAKSADSGKAYIFDITNGTLIKTLDNQTAFGEFGGAVAISGNYLIVGAHGSGDDTGGYSGKVYIYRTTSGDWSDAILLHSISNPNPDGNGLFDFFGISVDISGTYAVASGGGENSPTYRSGKAYIFDVTNGTLIKTLDNPSGGDDQFGGSVAISGNYIGVTAIFEDNGGTNTGTAYIYKLT